jgi:hypothetical protein
MSSMSQGDRLNHVARVWPPRKRDFRPDHAGLRGLLAMVSFGLSSRRTRMTQHFRSDDDGT